MKAVKGYQTEDGTFFEDRVSAELYEATFSLREAYKKVRSDNPNEFVRMVRALSRDVARYVLAYESVPKDKEEAPRDDYNAQEPEIEQDLDKDLIEQERRLQGLHPLEELEKLVGRAPRKRETDDGFGED